MEAAYGILRAGVIRGNPMILNNAGGYRDRTCWIVLKGCTFFLFNGLYRDIGL